MHRQCKNHAQTMQKPCKNHAQIMPKTMH
jgi:hypothetical protein